MNDQPKILVIDDEEIILVSVKKLLSREGYVVEGSARAADGLKRAREGNYDLVITDLMMPEMNGIELMHELRGGGLHTPFLMITGYPTIKTAMQALRLGAIDYIPKPFTRLELIGPVNRALRRKSSAPSELMPAPSTPTGPVQPGDHLVLPEHSWGIYEQEGTVAVGIEASFLEAAGRVLKVELPSVNEMIEQGYPTIKLRTEDGNEHVVFAPLSGRVIAVNQEMIDQPDQLAASSWMLRIIPSNLPAEALMLLKEGSGGERLGQK